MAYYLIEVLDSDGNDCSVLDYIVDAESKEQAIDRVLLDCAESYPDDESDGGFGTYHACDCECEHAGMHKCPVCALLTDDTGRRTTNGRIIGSCGDAFKAMDWDAENDESGICDACSDSWECSHGGILVSEEPEVYATYAEARAAHATYHDLIDLTSGMEVR